MKRQKFTLSSLVIVAGLLFLVSCKKDYVCSCVQTNTEPAYSYNGEDHPALIRVNTITNTFKSLKKNAESGCKQAEYIHTTISPLSAQGQGPIVETFTCELK
jgi:hypothetical protein